MTLATAAFRPRRKADAQKKPPLVRGGGERDGGMLAAKSGDVAGSATEQLMECLSVALQIENACAVLRRLPEALADVGPLPAP